MIRRSTLESCKPNEQLGPQASEIVWNRGHKLLQPHVHILNLISSERVYIYIWTQINFHVFFPSKTVYQLWYFPFYSLVLFFERPSCCKLSPSWGRHKCPTVVMISSFLPGHHCIVSYSCLAFIFLQTYNLTFNIEEFSWIKLFHVSSSLT